MNNPEYILVDEMGVIVEAVRTALALPVLNYQYGYITELNQTLADMNSDPINRSQKFPLVWLMQPYTIIRGESGYFGKLNNGRFIIIQESLDSMKANERMTANYKPVIYPIYREILKQIANSTVFIDYLVENIVHQVTDRYYWGEAQQSVFNDIVDAMDISGLQLKISDNPNCTTFSNL